jgi:hypothetical protein
MSLYIRVLIALVILLIIGFYVRDKVTTENKNYELFYNKNNCQPIFEPAEWNKKFVQASHNCYSYAMNQIEQDKVNRCVTHVDNNKSCGQRGPPRPSNNEYTFPSGKNITCDSITLGVLEDTLQKAEVLEGDTECPEDKYKVALFIDDADKSYHFLRKDKCNNPLGLWSHKNVTGPVTQQDVDGNLIYNPKDANLRYNWVNYDQMCNYLCIPDDNHLQPAN